MAPLLVVVARGRGGARGGTEEIRVSELSGDGDAMAAPQLGGFC